LTLVLVAAPGAVAGAQVVDTTRADSLVRDTTDYTGLFLTAQAEGRRAIPVPPRIGASKLLPLHSRLVIDRDSILWHNTETVGDLLTKVPGVFLFRGGWAGRPELPNYQARGATAVDYLLDGIPYLAIGQDSVMVDPSLLPVSLLDRMEVERLPGKLVVHLFTRRNDRNVPYSRIGIAGGDLQIARYQGQLEKRTAKGIGFSIAFDHLSVPNYENLSPTGDYSNTQGWIRLEYVPSSTFAAELRFLAGSPDREAMVTFDTPADTLSAARNGSRRDYAARVHWNRQKSGTGPRFDFLLNRVEWTDHIEQDSALVLTDSLGDSGEVIRTDTSYSVSDHQRSVNQLGVVWGYRLPTTSLDASLWYQSTWTPLDLRGSAGIAPHRWFSASVEGVYRKHEGERTSNWLTARAGVVLPLGISATATWRRGSEVARPAVLLDSAQALDDRSVAAAWRTKSAEITATYSWNAGYRPTGFAQYPIMGDPAASERTKWVTVNARLAPLQWVILDGWYSTPQGPHPEGQPPTHSVINGTIQSKFLPTFPSGIFNFKIQITMENWSPGVVGRDFSGAPVSLNGATFFRSYIGFQIGPFSAYYDRYNTQGTRLEATPGLQIPRFASTFGVRWEFRN
jgi:hypothetical protein